MKRILPIACSILFIGCGNPIQTSTTAVPDTASIEEPQTAKASISAEAPIPAPLIPPAEQLEPKTVPPKPATTPQKPAIPAKEKRTVQPAVDGNALYAQKCASCHGNKAEKSALNKSQVIADFSEQQMNDALHGYQAGTYGKEMKSLMQGQVKSLSPEQINALAKHISTL